MAKIETTMKPLEVLAVTQQIERELGRIRKSIDGQYADRTMDIDLLFYDDMCLNLPELVLPHPQMHLRDFVLRPMADLAPDFYHPLLKQTMAELLRDLNLHSGEATIINS